MTSDHDLVAAEASRRALLDVGADELPRQPWDHPTVAPDDTTLLRYVLWRANQNVGSASAAELTAGLQLLSSARSELDTLEAALLLTARSEGLTWSQIAEHLGVRSPQAAQQRYEGIAQRPGPGTTEAEQI